MLVDFKAKIQAWLDKGESVQIVAPPGFGKSRLGRSLRGLYIDTNLLQNSEEILSSIKSAREQKLIIIDALDEILDSQHQPLFKYLKALRDVHKYQLAYVFLTSRPIGHTSQALLGDLSYLVEEHVVNLPPLEIAEYDLFGWKATPAQLKTIAEISHGIPAVVKTCVLILRDGGILDPVQNPQLADILAKTGLVKPVELSASETRLLEILLANKNQLVSKDKICEAVYPDVKNRAGISDHAIDQLVHRLREKIKSKYSLQTHRGLGYKLT